jgi:hypothetical protein
MGSLRLGSPHRIVATISCGAGRAGFGVDRLESLQYFVVEIPRDDPSC